MNHFSYTIDYDSLTEKLHTDIASGINPGRELYTPVALNNGLHILAARPSMGKTTLMVQCLFSSGDQRDAYVYSPETSYEKFSERIGQVYAASGNLLPDKKVHICTEQIPVETLCEELKETNGTVYIDDLQLLYSDKNLNGIDNITGYIEDRLYELSRDRCVVVLSQVNASAWERPGHIPRPSDIRFYEDIWEIADQVVTFAFRDYYEESREEYSAAIFADFLDDDVYLPSKHSVRDNRSGTFVRKTKEEINMGKYNYAEFGKVPDDEDVSNMNYYIRCLIPGMLRELAEKTEGYNKNSGSPESWKNELRHGAELWENVVTEDYPDDDNVTVKEWQTERKEKLHRAMAWLEENFFDLWD